MSFDEFIFDIKVQKYLLYFYFYLIILLKYNDDQIENKFNQN